jgi:inner membrane protein
MLNEKLKTSVGAKLLMISFLVLLLMIPSIWISSIISEREERREEVLYDITSKWGSDQFITGPILVIPVEFIGEYADGKKYTTTSYIYLLSESLDIESTLDPELRYRGIYQILLYKSDILTKGKFNLNNLEELDLINGKIRYDKAHLEIGISDLKGLTNNLKIKWNGKDISAKTGLKESSVISKGLHFLIPLQSKIKEYSFIMNINLNGSEQIQFSPTGKDTKVRISSPWNHPSFCGDFLPQLKIIDNQHFEAQWKIFNLNRNFPHISLGNPLKIEDNFFGIKLFYTVDQYQQTTRSIKYAFMFIGLTFICYFLIEIISKRQIHPIQYLLIGSGLILFYLVLLSLSEHLTFSIAYLIAYISMILLIAFYTKASLGEFRLVSIVSTVLFVLYGFLYINLQLHDYALLFGSIGLFITLAAVMFFTRNINWFTVLKLDNKKTKPVI